MVMKRVGIADLKARLSEHLRYVRGGRSLTVLDRGTPVAELVPLKQANSGLVVRPPTSGILGFAGLKMPPPLKVKTDVLKFLAEERQSHR